MRKLHRNLKERGLAWLLTAAIVAGLLPAFSPAAKAAEAIPLPLQSATLTPGQTYELAAGNAAGVSFTIPAGEPVTIYVNGTTLIKNKQSGKSPINVLANGSLNLIVNDLLELKGQDGSNGSSSAANQTTSGGTGGYAGLHVSKQGSLNLLGTGILTAYGGDAGDGGDTVPGGDCWGSSGGGGAAAGIGGNGGNGGDTVAYSIGALEGADGYTGESAGDMNFASSVRVYTYGGGGGSGGTCLGADGAGGGGYPAAGIGGGGGGGGASDSGGNGGGFSAGAVTSVDGTNGGVNGQVPNTASGYAAGGSSYFGVASFEVTNAPGEHGKIGGERGWSAFYHGGSGGAAGEGGSIKLYSKLGNIHAYNGSYMTEQSSDSYISKRMQSKQTPIYAQLGYSLDNMRSLSIAHANWDGNQYTFVNGTPDGNQILTTAYGLGIGSGAGYRETSNGTVTYVEPPTRNLADGSISITDGSETYYDRGKGFKGGRTERLEDMGAGGLPPARRPSFPAGPCAPGWEP